MRERHSGCKSTKGVARLTIAGIVAAALAVVNITAASASGWALVSSPNTAGSNNNLFGVACSSSTSCVAVGFYYTVSNVEQTLVETWSGTAWSITPSPNQGAGGSALSGVACTSSTSCTAVGAYANGSSVTQTLVETWNGIAWSITPSTPNQGTGSNYLNGVSCASSISCVAVGQYTNGSSISQTLVETWNGTGWSITSSPNKGTAYNTLDGVACTSSTSCVAVGFYFGSTDQTLVETWNGTTWSATTSPNQGTGGNDLGGVACTSSTSCMAVGYYFNGSADQTLAESWNGTVWSIVASPNQGSNPNVLFAVSCTSSTSCVAVGYYYNGSVDGLTLVETWNGTSWSITPSPNESGSFNVLNGVACTSSKSCVAVGFDRPATVDQTLAETWNGTVWSVVVSPDLGDSDNGLSAVSCTSSTSCMAVGAYSNGVAQQTLVERWNGSTWAVIASPNQGTSSNALSGVACSTSSSCVAVGTWAKAGVEQTLIENWNGTTWTIATSPNVGTGSNILNGVACVSSTSCVAVGYYFNGLAQTLVESWNGSAWTISTSANQPSSTNSLVGVSCTSSTACTAVGGSVSATSISTTLIERWNGTTWSITPSPNPGPIGNELNGVTCTGASSCTAVGDYSNASNLDQTLVESWNGTTWTVVASPNAGSMRNSLAGIACTSATSCVAVGFSFNTPSTYQTLVETWNGSTWSIVASPNQGSSNNLLSGVACTSSTSCTAVGAYTSSGVDQTLVETGPASSVSSSISVTSPRAGASWARGSSHAIKWATSGSPGTDVKIQLLQSGTVVKTIAKSVLTSAGIFTWKLPSTLSPAATYQIKIVSTTNSKVFGTSGDFSIT